MRSYLFAVAGGCLLGSLVALTPTYGISAAATEELYVPGDRLPEYGKPVIKLTRKKLPGPKVAWNTEVEESDEWSMSSIDDVVNPGEEDEDRVARVRRTLAYQSSP